ncbi:MAG: bifunctional phosphoribosylaminoimidazolecarboxamide formyltransferase/IMP cyclohydrolase [Solirubrobacterales bacterium]|nr:bifunctional phosphoribosylaminoimidazolecarboxamide formyltransferase/IMP cyclohydrolase [Solirubrobacterales bacterium]
MSKEIDALELTAPGQTRVARALLSVSDKSGIVDFARGLIALGVEIVSTGGTATELGAAGLPIRAISDFTGFPEIMDGRVKTLHPKLYAGLLALRDDSSHLEAARDNDVEWVDLVCVNLYPFEQTAARELGESDGRLCLATRERLAGAAFACVARYDAAIASWFAQKGGAFPELTVRAYEKVCDLPYGENPHQRAAFYAELGQPAHLLQSARQLGGRALSFNNILDLSAAKTVVAEFDDPACVIVKHNNPCGAAVARNASDAYAKALAGDPVSAFGGVICLNQRVDAVTAEAISQQFVEVICAPGYDADALAILAKKEKLRILDDSQDRQLGGSTVDLKAVVGGLLAQDRDGELEDRAAMEVVTERQPSEEEWAELLFSWRICKHVRSNAIVLSKDQATVGIGAGQMSRVDSVRIAIEKATGESSSASLEGVVLASDAFFPFADGPQVAIDAGVRAIIQPGGSMRDGEVIQAADAAGVTMVFTQRRHFRH